MMNAWRGRGGTRNLCFYFKSALFFVLNMGDTFEEDSS